MVFVGASTVVRRPYDTCEDEGACTVDMKRYSHAKLIKIASLSGTILFIILSSYNTLSGADTDAPKRLAEARPGDCSACHTGGKQVLPGDHVQTKTMRLEQCLACHPKEKAAITLKMPTSHAHMLSGITCQACHGQKMPYSPVDMKTCTACHSTEILAKAPAEGINKPNPHNSHYGTDVDCALCHRQHAKSEFMCAQCHDFKNVTPSPLTPLSVSSTPAKEKETAVPEKSGAAP